MTETPGIEVTHSPHHSYWRLSRPDDFDLFCFEDGTVLHDDLGSAVVFLTPVAGEVIRLLMGGRSWQATHVLTSELLGDDAQDVDLTAVESLLEGLKFQGLTERRGL